MTLLAAAAVSLPAAGRQTKLSGDDLLRSGQQLATHPLAQEP